METGKVLGIVNSTSNPNRVYEICLGKDGAVYCTCPAWSFSGKKNGGNHTCKHLAIWFSDALDHVS